MIIIKLSWDMNVLMHGEWLRWQHTARPVSGVVSIIAMFVIYIGDPCLHISVCPAGCLYSLVPCHLGDYSTLRTFYSFLWTRFLSLCLNSRRFLFQGHRYLLWGSQPRWINSWISLQTGDRETLFLYIPLWFISLFNEDEFYGNVQYFFFGNPESIAPPSTIKLTPLGKASLKWLDRPFMSGGLRHQGFPIFDSSEWFRDGRWQLRTIGERNISAPTMVLCGWSNN